MLLYFAGAERKSVQQLLLDIGVKNIFVSYYYMRGRKGDLLWEAKKEGKINIMVDSGVYTLQTALRKKGIKMSLNDADKYVKEYTQWLDKYRKYIDACVNFDMDITFSEDIIQKWDDEYFIPRVKDGMDICFVYHLERGKMRFVEMLDKYKFVGIGSSVRLSPGVVTALVRAANLQDIKIHGLAFTKMKQLRHAVFYSVDSTTWTSGQRYGFSFIFIQNKLHQIPKERKLSMRRRYKYQLQQKGLDWDALMDDDNNEVAKMNAIAWNEWGEWWNKCFGRSREDKEYESGI